MNDMTDSERIDKLEDDVKFLTKLLVTVLTIQSESTKMFGQIVGIPETEESAKIDAATKQVLGSIVRHWKTENMIDGNRFD